MNKQELILYLKRALAFKEDLGLAFREPDAVRYLEGKLIEISGEELIIATSFGAIMLKVENLVLVDGYPTHGATPQEVRLAQAFLPDFTPAKHAEGLSFADQVEDFIEDLWEDKISPADFYKL